MRKGLAGTPHSTHGAPSPTLHPPPSLPWWKDLEGLGEVQVVRKPSWWCPMALGGNRVRLGAQACQLGEDQDPGEIWGTVGLSWEVAEERERGLGAVT